MFAEDTKATGMVNPVPSTSLQCMHLYIDSYFAAEEWEKLCPTYNASMHTKV